MYKTKMNNLTYNTAKKKKKSLSKVLDELKPYNYKIVVVLEKEDYETIESIQDRECEILFQKNRLWRCINSRY